MFGDPGGKPAPRSKSATNCVRSATAGRYSGAGAEAVGPVGGLTQAAPMWAAAHLAAAQGGRLVVHGGTLTLYWPTAPTW